MKIRTLAAVVVLAAAPAALAGPPELATRDIALGDTVGQFQAKIAKLDSNYKVDRWNRTLANGTEVESAYLAVLRQPTGGREIIQVAISPRTKLVNFIARYSEYDKTESFSLPNTVSSLTTKFGGKETAGSVHSDGSGERVWYYGKGKGDLLNRQPSCKISAENPPILANDDMYRELPFKLPETISPDCGRAVAVKIYGGSGDRAGYISKLNVQIIDFAEWYEDVKYIAGLVDEQEKVRAQAVRTAPAAPQ